MTTRYISIAHDVTQANVRAIESASRSGSATVVHSICRTLAGRRSLARRLKAAGLAPDIVRNVGWATSDPTPTPVILRPAAAQERPTKPQKRKAKSIDADSHPARVDEPSSPGDE